ncbi:MAG: PIG-L domain-containing protein [Pseudonocardiales bacterium]|nr:MAG: PIG-L domain-containing protein [Pseudonocardiales bacterium]
MTAGPLARVDEGWSAALAIVAHPDDLEYGCAAAIAKWTSHGKNVAYCLVTRGEAGIDGLAPEQAGPLREQEQLASAAIVGVQVVDFLGYNDGMLEYGLPMRRDIAAAVRKHRPQVVITGNFHDTWAPGVLNQADHIAVGRAVVDGVRDAANRWVFRDLLAHGLAPWRGVRTVLVAGSPAATHGVDVTEDFATGVQSLKAHSAYLAGLGSGPMSDPEEFLESTARVVGTRLSCTFGVAFEVIDF